jgi:ribosomal protein L17
MKENQETQETLGAAMKELSNWKVEALIAQAERDKIKAERDALAAQVEMLQKHIERVALCYHNNTGNEPSLSVFHRALDEAESAVFKEPSSFLAEIRAEAVIRFGAQNCIDYKLITEYAEKIRQGGAKC